MIWLIMLLLFGGTSEEQICEAGVEAFVAEAYDLATLAYATDPDWIDVYDTFSDALLAFANTCPQADLTYDQEIEAATNEDRPYRIHLSITPIDLNLDDEDEWLLQLHTSGILQSRKLQSFASVLIPADDPLTSESWLLESLWPLDVIESARPAGRFYRALSLQSVMVHDIADVEDRTYMALPFWPGIGDDPYVGGMVVIRWDAFTPEILMVIEQDCVFTDWQTGDDGQLYMPMSYSVPWQGCTIPSEIPEDGIPIPGALMP